MSDLGHIVQRLAERAEGSEQVEAYAEEVTETSVSAYEGEVERLTSSSSRGLGVRVVAGGRLGYAYTCDLSEDGLAACLADARANLEVASEDAGNVLPDAEPFEHLDGIFDLRMVDTSPERKVELALDLEARTRAADRRVSGVESAAYGDEVRRIAIASSTGVLGEYATTQASCYSVALAGGDDQAPQTGYGLDSARALDDLDVGRVAAEASSRATRMLGAAKPATRTVPVVFDALAATSLLGVLVSGLSAEAVQKGRSLFADKIGEQVGAPGLRLMDDGRLLDGPGAAPFDAEGVPTRTAALLEDGVLRAFMYNTTTAARGGTRSTGNARRSFKSSPGVGPHNIFFAPGAKDQAALMADAGEGLLVQDVSGVHSGANPITGDFSVGVSGLWIRGGELAEPVREVTVAAHLLDILRGIVAVGSDLRFSMGSIGGASLLVQQMTVAGA